MPKVLNANQPLQIPDAARATGCGYQELYRAVMRHELPFMPGRHVKVTVADVVSWMAGREAAAAVEGER